MNDDKTFTVLVIRQVMAKTRYRRTSIHDFGKVGGSRYDASFPMARKLGPRRTVWIESEIDAWIKNRIDKQR